MTNEPTPSKDDDQLLDALGAVEHALGQLDDCTDKEKEALSADIRSLRDMLAKLQAGRVEIAVFGEISTGKSALINALVGEQVASVNIRGGWTKDIWDVPWNADGYVVPGFADSSVVLLDTPGLNEVDGKRRADMARDTAERADLVLFVTDSDLNETEYTALAELATGHKPIILVLNKVDLYTPKQLDDLMSLFRGPRLKGLVEPENIVQVTADPRPVEYHIESADGSVRQEWREPEPNVDALRVRILEVLQHDGSDLIALNASMFAADRSDRVGAMRVKMRNDRANSIIWSYAAVKSIAVAVNHFPVLDVVGGTAVDAAMVVTLGKVYGINITTDNARDLVTSILKAAGWMMAGEVIVSSVSSFFKGLTWGASTAISALPQGAAAGYGSYIVGQAARYYFEHGASWGEKGPKRVVARILENTDKQSVIEHLKNEIKNKLSKNRYSTKG
ncbi:YcjF family protein [Aeoliella mucimassa]|uniref:tRNA modification GTPase MnmE n=1 Tax=Aeoliella mucimassa TaxID=2527972 RepID=A0A518AHT3_9BACT|nr:GTP-binding protein [Aeoliella mucimassa]QDU54265.1 tRNA modification GTPase MnmE [Aeoliella mucimassa]